MNMKQENQAQNKILIVGTKSTSTKAANLKTAESVKLIPFPLLDTFILEAIHFSNQLYDWLIFTSPAAVKHFNNLPNKPTCSNIATVGPSTRKTAEGFGLRVDFMPKYYNSTSFGEELTEIVKHESKILFPCSELADDFLETHFKQKGIDLERVNLYKPALLPKPSLQEFDSIAFLSGSSAEAMCEYFGKEVVQGKKIAAIGSKAAKKIELLFGIQPLVPNKSTAENTIRELL